MKYVLFIIGFLIPLICLLTSFKVAVLIWLVVMSLGMVGVLDRLDKLV